MQMRNVNITVEELESSSHECLITLIAQLFSATQYPHNTNSQARLALKQNLIPDYIKDRG